MSSTWETWTTSERFRVLVELTLVTSSSTALAVSNVELVSFLFGRVDLGLCMFGLVASFLTLLMVSVLCHYGLKTYVSEAAAEVEQRLGTGLLATYLLFGQGASLFAFMGLSPWFYAGPLSCLIGLSAWSLMKRRYSRLFRVKKPMKAGQEPGFLSKSSREPLE